MFKPVTFLNPKMPMPRKSLSGLLTGLISYWKLDEASGTRVDSVTTTGNNLTDVNTVTSNPGIISNAGQFTKANQEVLSITTNSSLDIASGTSFTVALWFYGDTVPAPSGIFCKGGSNGGQAEYFIRWRASAKPTFVVSPDGNTQTSVDWSAALTTSTWYLLVAWYDVPDGHIYIQVNNGTPVGAIYTGDIWSGHAINTTKIGDDGGGVGTFWNGRIDEVGFWKRVLTATERTNLYNAGAGVTYPFTGVP